MSAPVVSCLCPTYGRPHLLEESIECFLQQSYSNKELIVFNDHADQELVLDNPLVRVVNTTERCKSLGVKMNMMKEFIHPDAKYVCVWEDDDLFGRNRLEDSVLYMEECRKDAVKPHNALFSVNNCNYQVASNLFHSQTCYRREFYMNRAYDDVTVGHDAAFENNMDTLFLNVSPLFWYVYRWGNGTHHLSGLNEHESWRYSAMCPALHQQTGKVVLQPQFRRDYWQDIGEWMKQQNMNEWEKWWAYYGLRLPS